MVGTLLKVYCIGRCKSKGTSMGHRSFETARSLNASVEDVVQGGSPFYMACGPTDTYRIYNILLRYSKSSNIVKIHAICFGPRPEIVYDWRLISLKVARQKL